MMTQEKAHTSDVFRAVADPVRRAILDLLRQGDRSAGKIAEAFPLSRPAISRHLRLLRSIDLVMEIRKGRSRIYRLNSSPLTQLEEWLQPYGHFWQRVPSRKRR